MNRSSMRRHLRRRRQKLTRKQRRLSGTQVSRRLRRHPWFRRAVHVAVYQAFDGELPLDEFVRATLSLGRRIYVPKLLPRLGMVFLPLSTSSKLKENCFGILEPANGPLMDPRNLDAVITPLVGFDDSGTRLGMGAGHYDRCFSFLRQRGNWRRPKLVGAGYQFQQVPSLERAPWDIPLDGAVTEFNNFFF